MLKERLELTMMIFVYFLSRIFCEINSAKPSGTYGEMSALKRANSLMYEADMKRL